MTKVDLSIFDFDENTSPQACREKLIAGLRAILKSLEREVILANEVAKLQFKLFGKSSEKRAKRKAPDPQVFDEAKATPEDLANDVASDEAKDEAIVEATQTLENSTQPVTVKAPEVKKKKSGRKPIPSHYPRVDVIHDLNPDQKICSCGCQMTMFDEDVSEQLEVIPARIQVLRHSRLKYACKTCQEGVKIAPVQTQAIAKTLAAPGLLAHVAVAKFDDHLPLYRQSEIWNRVGIDISRSTLSSWILKMGSTLSPIVTMMQKHIVQSVYVKADETTTQVLRTPGKKDTSQSYMWVYLTGNNPKPAVVYDYQETRKGDCAKEFLKGFKGVLQTDGYSGYHCVTAEPSITSMGCWAHARRKFYEIWKILKKEGVASKAIEIIGNLYDIEANIKDESSDVKQKFRQEKSKPIIDAFHLWLLTIKPNVHPKGDLDKAIYYVLNQWECLIYYLQDGSVDIDNNATERQIKPFAVGRGNWMFMGSPDGARSAANLYSIIETAKLNHRNPEGYLKFLLEHKIDDTDPGLLEKMMPWNVILPEEYPPPPQICDEKIKNTALD